MSDERFSYHEEENTVEKERIVIFITIVHKGLNEPPHEISNNVVCATNKASDQPAHMCSLIRAFDSHLSIL